MGALESDRLTQGPEVGAFEKEFAKAVEAPYAVSFSSGTAALHAACFAAVLPGSTPQVLTSALGFVASANAPKYLGAEVKFADIGPEWNVVPRTLADAFGGGIAGYKADVVLPVHFAGLPAPTKELRQFGKAVIEDACHALGARTQDGPVGNCAHSDFTCFSFHPTKAITTGEGGMVTCRIKANVKKLRQFRNHGFKFSDGWRRDQTELGMNYRLSDIHAALGRSQLKKLPQFIERRREIAERYQDELEGVTLPPSHPDHAWHLFVIRHPERNQVYEDLKKYGIQTQVHYRPIYQNTFYKHTGSECPNAEAYFAECLSLPIFPGLTDAEQTKVIKAVRDVV